MCSLFLDNLLCPIDLFVHLLTNTGLAYCYRFIVMKSGSTYPPTFTSNLIKFQGYNLFCLCISILELYCSYKNGFTNILIKIILSMDLNKLDFQL